MKVFYYLLILFISIFIKPSNLFPQTSQDIVGIMLSVNTISELKNLSIALKDTFKIEGGLAVEKRALDFGVWYHTYEFEISPKGMSGTYLIGVMAMVKNDTIIINAVYLLYERNYQIKHDSLATENYISAHRQIYKTNISKEKFLEELLSHYILEFGCGESGSYYSPEVKQMKKWIKTSNKTVLNQWLRSPNPELQTYGALGLTKIQKKGRKLTSDEQRIIAHLKRKNNPIRICTSCDIGETQPFIEILENY